MHKVKVFTLSHIVTANNLNRKKYAVVYKKRSGNSSSQIWSQILRDTISISIANFNWNLASAWELHLPCCAEHPGRSSATKPRVEWGQFMPIGWPTCNTRLLKIIYFFRGKSNYDTHQNTETRHRDILVAPGLFQEDFIIHWNLYIHTTKLKLSLK